MSSQAQEIVPGVAHLPLIFVSAYFVGEPGGPWILIDTGLPGKAGAIRAAAQERYGPDARPEAIYLTHGHFDHVGSALELATGWNVPVYAHRLELPYITGRSNYPPPDPTVGGPLALMARFMPSRAVDLRDQVRELAPDGVVPEMPDWQWDFTPGHTPGHVSYFRKSDATLLAGDAIATANFDSWIGFLTMQQELARAGTPFNFDWDLTRHSVAMLARLRPATIAAGHGTPLSGPDVAAQLERFSAAFPMPSHGRYVATSARTDEHGVVSVPPPAPDPLPKLAVALGLAALAAVVVKKRSDAA